MTKLFLLASIFAVSMLQANHKDVSVKVDGVTYQCNGGSSGPTNPACLKEVTDYCYSKTSMSTNECFGHASNGCSGSGAQYPTCVKQSTDYCYSKTSMSAKDCFMQSLTACKGNFDSMKNMFDAVTK